MWNRFTERPKNRDALCITALVSFALCVFWKTLFLGQSISHIYLTAQRDVLFRQFYSPLDPGYDESLYLMHIPFLHLVVDFWRHLQLPLWNPYGGFGTPLIGDITARPFSLLKIPFLLFPSIYTLNATLIFELTLAAVGTYVLTGALSLPRYARVFAALAYFLCPYLLRNSELNIGTSASLLPFVMWTFVWLANKPNIKRAILAAVSTAVFISIGHAITSFNDIAFSALVALLVFATKDGRTLGLRVAEGGKWIALVAGLSICFSAPVLLTFIEFFRNSDCYKFSADVEIGVPPWPGIVLNLLQPLYQGGSPFIGSITLPLAAITLFSQKASIFSKALFAASIFAFICVCRPGFIANIWNLTPAKHFPGSYFEPVFLLLLILCAAFGFKLAVEELKEKRILIAFVCLIGSVLAVPLALHLVGFNFAIGNFDNSMPSMSFNFRTWLICLIASGAVAASAFFINKTRTPFVCLVILATVISQGQISRLSLPTQPNFRYDVPEPIPFLQSQNERIISRGFDLLAPNTNLVFKIANANTHNVMPPNRYTDFMRNAGAKITTFNTVIDKEEISKMMDFAGVKYIMSLGPIRSQDEADEKPDSVAMANPVDLVHGQLRMLSGWIGFDAVRSDITGSLKFSLKASDTDKYSFNVVVLDETKATKWFGGQYPLEQPQNTGYIETKIAGLVPLDLKAGQTFYVGIQMFDSKALKYIEPYSKGENETVGPVLILGTFKVSDRNAHQPGENAPRYKLLSESGKHRVRIYENTRSLGHAYLVFKPKICTTAEQALEAVSSKDFDPRTNVVVETKEITPEITTMANAMSAPTAISVPLTTQTATKVVISCNCPQNGFLVLADSFYPGWKATVDGKETQIVHANYLFRGVALSKGHHEIIFTYSSKPMIIGFLLLLSGVFASLGLLGIRKRLKRAASEPEEQATSIK